jgi:2-polyprenyl-3-methyl-5-hydroxy-6-metoxy-1,4-benzoquinol methylase
MDEHLLLETWGAAARHPWFRIRNRFLLERLDALGVRPGASVLDAGCGWGLLLLALETKGYRVTGLDHSPELLRRLDRPGRTLIEADLRQPPGTDAPSFDAVLAIDVLEHADDDALLVRRLLDLVAPGGLLLVSVPALPFLYSRFDEAAGHRRRYRAATLRQTFLRAGAPLLGLRHWGAWMVAPMAARRLHEGGRGSPATCYADHLRPPGRLGGLLFELFGRLEAPFAHGGHLPFGSSIIAWTRVGADQGAPGR